MSISWTICKQSAARSRQTTTSAPHHSIFTGQMLFLTPNKRCLSTEGYTHAYKYSQKIRASEHVKKVNKTVKARQSITSTEQLCQYSVIHKTGSTWPRNSATGGPSHGSRQGRIKHLVGPTHFTMPGPQSLC